VSNKVDTGGKRLNLFPANDKVFNMMEAVADKTNVDIFAEGKKSSTKGIHTALLAAGMTPAYGNIADVADATLYALEGEFGEAAWSMAAAIPVIGQMVAGRRAAKVAKEAGEKMVTLYRGVDKWHAGKMVKEGKFIGGGKSIEQPWQDVFPSKLKETTSWVTNDFRYAKHFAEKQTRAARNAAHPLFKNPPQPGPVLEFEVPLSYIKKYGLESPSKTRVTTIFEEGIPKEFLKKVHK
jgi:hypothetical protein